MALRFRTRLSLTISFLVFLTVSVMTLAVLSIYAYDMVLQYNVAGENLSKVSSRNINFGVRVPERVRDRIEGQMVVHGLLAAELIELAERPGAASPDEISAALRRVIARSSEYSGYPLIDEITISDSAGKPYISAHREGSDAATPKDLDHFEDLLTPGATPMVHEEKRGGHSRYVGVSSGDKPRIVQIGASRQLMDSVAAEFSIQEAVERFMLPDEYTRIAVIDESGRVLAAIDAMGNTGREAVDEATIGACRVFLRNRLLERDINLFGRDMAIISRLESESGDSPYALFVLYPSTEALMTLFGRLGVVASVGFGMVVFGILVSIILSRGLSKPIVTLSEGVREFGRGNLNYRMVMRRKDEFHDLAQAFNTMAISMQEYMHELQQETGRRERLESEFRIAEEMQRALLPQAPPDVIGLHLVGWSQPSREVGGDFFDFIPMGPNRVAVVVGDAAGKGLSAALLITQCWSVLRTLAQHVHEPGELLFRTNNEFYSRIGTTYRFVTLFMMIFDGERGVVKYATAGHPPPMLIHGDDGRTQWLEVEGSFPLGLEKDTRFPETEFDLKPNDTIVLYSDGLTDAQNPDRAAYGEARIEAHLAQCGGLSPEDIVSGMRNDLEIHRQGQEATDDTTIVAVQYRPEGEERVGESGEAASG